MNKKILIIGASSYIANQFCSFISSRVPKLDVLPLTRKAELVKDHNFHIEVPRYDAETLFPFFESYRPDTVVIFTGHYRFDATPRDRALFEQSMPDVALAVSKVCETFNAATVISFGSVMQSYPELGLPAECEYGLYKDEMESILLESSIKNGFPFYSLRIADNFSKHDKRKKLMVSLLAAMTGNLPLIIRNPDRWVNLIYLDDLFSILINRLVLSNSKLESGVYNLVSPVSMQIRDIVEKIKILYPSVPIDLQKGSTEDPNALRSKSFYDTIYTFYFRPTVGPLDLLLGRMPK